MTSVITISTATWAKIIAVLSALAGIAGTVLVPIYGQSLAAEVQGVLSALAALLLLVPGVAATSLVHTAAKARILARIAIEAPSRPSATDRLAAQSSPSSP